MAKNRYKLLAGRHSINIGSDEKPQLVKFSAGDVIETDLELDTMFNSRGSTKFQRLDYVEIDTEESLARLEQELAQRKAALKAATGQQASKSESTKAEAWGGDDLSRKTLNELRDIASANGINLKNAKSREEALKVIQDSLVEA